MANVVLSTLSTSSSMTTRKDLIGDSRFKWESIKKFLYLATTCATSSCNFDIFSRLTEKVTVFDFIMFQIAIGLSYMFADFFIRQYTGRIDFNKTLNPLLKGLNYGIVMQSALWTIIHANDLADVVRYFAASLYGTPAWSQCSGQTEGSECREINVIRLKCMSKTMTPLNMTSVHQYYVKQFVSNERSVLTTKFFMIGLVWITNFFFSSVTDVTLLKLFRLIFFLRSLTTVITLILVMMSCKAQVSPAFRHLLDINASHSYTAAIGQVAFVFGVGLVGIYDFGSMSPTTLIDNAVVIFAIFFTGAAFMRSLIVQTLFLTMSGCVSVESKNFSSHYLLFSLLPMTTEFLVGQKVYIFYIYINMILALAAYLALLTLTLAKLLHSEFKSVKILYICGILCFVGFLMSLLLGAFSKYMLALIYGLKMTMLYLGGSKILTIMWIYGVQRFATDIHFWLGFKPTIYWTLSWLLAPILLNIFVGLVMNSLTKRDETFQITAFVWFFVSIAIVLIFQVKTIARYIVRSNLAAAFKSSAKYGPMDPDDRKRRKNYDEATHFRQCRHDCILLDDRFDCNHTPLVFKKQSSAAGSSQPPSETSLTNIFKEPNAPSELKAKTSSIIDINTMGRYD